MSGQWFEERKEILMQELLAGFVDAAGTFKGLHRDYARSGGLQYDEWAVWTGSESGKGPLWRLKDLSHSIFRRPDSKPLMHEAVLDWTLSAIFHECMKIREEAYQVGHPLELNQGRQAPVLPEVRLAMEEWEQRMAQIRISSRQGLDNVQRLFQVAWKGLRRTLISHREMGLLMRYLAENRHRLIEILGEEEWRELMEELHPLGEADTWYLAAMSYHKGGWRDKALQALRKAVALCGEHPLAARMYRSMTGAPGEEP